MTIFEELASMDLTHYEFEEAELYIRCERMDTISEIANNALSIDDNGSLRKALTDIVELTR